jgi:MmyB-like transcription regulator ligand binding domain
VRASREVREAIAGALRLTPAERNHLILLGRGEQAPAVAPPAERVVPSVKRLIANLGGNPAFILGRRWDYLAWNRAASVVFGDFGAQPKSERNHVWQMFADPARREQSGDWDHATRLMVARFRADSARHVGDPTFEELISALKRSSPEFCKLWKRHEVAQTGAGRKELNHPIAGRLVFEHAVFNPAETPEQRLALYSPLPEEDTPAKLARLLVSTDPS